MGEAALDYSWKPHAGPQNEFLCCGEFEVLFGGAAGPGKSDCLIMDALRYSWHPQYRGVIFRRTFPQLQEIIDRCHEYVPLFDEYAEWRASQNRWYLSSGGRLNLSHLQHEANKYDHQGRQYSYIGFDELTQFTETQYLYLFSRCRALAPDLPKYIRATTNPGGIGHAWVKKRFQIGMTEPRTPIIEEVVNSDTGEVYRMSRVFIPATLDDNPSLLNNDPMYLARLELLPESERKRLRYGNWEVFDGQAFGELNEDAHSFDFEPPPEWETFTIFDWGFAKPSYYQVCHYDFDGRIWISREKVWRKDGTDDEGVRRPAPEVARDILAFEREHGIQPRTRLADPAIWSAMPAFRKGETFGKSIHDDFMAEGLVFIKANNDRIPGRQQIHHRLALDDDKHPRLLVHKRCRYWWETMPLMVESEKNPEDIEHKDAPDHAYDCTRYACQWHPIRPKVAVKPDTGSFQAERRKLIAAKRHAAKYGVDLTTAYGRVR